MIVRGIFTCALVLSACAPSTGPTTTMPAPATSMTGMGAVSAPQVPAVRGFAAGEEIAFIHTEASDPQVADMLTKMMGSPVLVVPALAQVPASTLANVYVFKNGVKGDGPFGAQADVFDSTPARSGYSPLRAVHFVTWKEERQVRILRSVDELNAASAKGEVTIERSGAVVNMPMLRWPGGQR